MEAKKCKELTKIINICKKHGVLELKLEGIELKLSPHAILPDKPKSTSQDKEPVTQSYTDDETLFWSSGGLPEAQ